MTKQQVNAVETILNNSIILLLLYMIIHDYTLLLLYILCRYRRPHKQSLLIGYEPAGPTMHPPPPKRSRVGSFFSHRYLVLPNFFPQRKSGFCRRY